MVSGFVTSPLDHSRIFSGDAKPILIASKVIGWKVCSLLFSAYWHPFLFIIIKGENIPEPGIPESFKVLLKELQSLGLDVRVLRDDNTEVEIMETVDMGETDFRSLIEGDRKYRQEENLGAQGYTEQEFEGEELVDVEEDPSDDDFAIEFEETDDFAYDDNE